MFLQGSQVETRESKTRKTPLPSVAFGSTNQTQRLMVFAVKQLQWPLFDFISAFGCTRITRKTVGKQEKKQQKEHQRKGTHSKTKNRFFNPKTDIAYQLLSF